MSIAHLLDHTARIWRPSVALGSLKQDVRTYHQVAQVGAAVRRRAAPRGDPGPGLTPSGTRVVYFDIGTDVVERDVVQLIAGPEAPERLEVDDMNSPRGHHIEAVCRLWAGKLPDDGAS